MFFKLSGDWSTTRSYQARRARRLYDAVFSVATRHPFDGELATLLPVDGSDLTMLLMHWGRGRSDDGFVSLYDGAGSGRRA